MYLAKRSLKCKSSRLVACRANSKSPRSIDLACILSAHIYTPDRRQSKTLILSTKVDRKSLETEFSIAIGRPSSDKWQSKILFLATFYLRMSIVKSIFDCRLSDVIHVKKCVHLSHYKYKNIVIALIKVN